MDVPAYQHSVMPNGLRVGTATLPGRNSASIGLWIGSGSRHEPAAVAGVAHLVEHMVFKGTARRSSRRISLDIEGVGGELNAFTSEDHTCYHAVVPAARLGGAADVLADIFSHARFSARDCAREKEVILEEIQMYRENPGQHVEDMLSAAVWPAHPLGRLITGTARSLSHLGPDDLHAWTRRAHVAANTVVAVASPYSHAEVLAMLTPLFGNLPRGNPPRSRPFKSAARAPLVLADTRETEQTHVALGFRTPGRRHRHRFALRLLSVALGETMGSRLFHSLREKRGLCYAVHSETDVFEETGVFEIYTAVENGKLEAALRALAGELSRAVAQAPSGKELAMAKEFTLGQQSLWFESTVNQMNWVGESLLWHGAVFPEAKARKKLLAVTGADMAAVAAAVFHPRRAALAIIGPHARSAPARDWLGWT